MISYIGGVQIKDYTHYYVVLLEEEGSTNTNEQIARKYLPVTKTLEIVFIYLFFFFFFFALFSST